VSPRKPPWEQGPSGAPLGHFWVTLGYRRVESPDDKTAVIEWDASDSFSFPDGNDGRIIHGGMVATLLDTAMAGACIQSLRPEERFLTADLHTEFYRPARPGVLRATGRVVRRTRGIAFCAADATDPDGKLVASARCTQIVRKGSDE
jgi:uncharacterized protein (TIGR00369 family)